jgi:toxin-antitoxin system PIN domain toxin
VIAVDTNILVHAHRADSAWFAAAKAAIANLAAGPGAWAIPWPCLHEFTAIVTHSRIFKTPTPLKNACDQVDAWLESPSLVLLSEGPVYWSAMKQVLLSGQVAGPKVHDARIAALCQSGGVSTLLTADRDFSRFPSLATRNPLIV